MRIKKAVAVILSAVITLMTVSVISFADTEGIYTYTVSGETASITRINYAGIKELTIPETLGGYPVTAISQIGNTYSFGTSNMVEVLHIPASITVLGYGALRLFDCARVVVDEDNPNYSSDEAGVVFNKDKTTLVSCPCSLQQKEYTVPDTVKDIGYCAFERCAFIEKIILPEGLTSMGNQSFCQMPKLREINIPEGITELGQNMFIQCSSLESITLPSTLIKVSNSSLSETPLKSVVVPDGVTQVDTYAFESCKKLEYIELPTTLQSIGYEALANCDSLKYIFYRGSEEDWASIDINSSNNDDLAKYKIVYNYAPEIGYPGIDYSFSDGVLSLAGEGATPQFTQGDYHYWDAYASETEVLIIDGNISEIGAYSFDAFPKLEYVIAYSDEFNIAENTFLNCGLLKNIIITGKAVFSSESFNAPEATIFIDSNSNPGIGQSENTVRFSYSDGTLEFIDPVSFDMYHLLDLVSALAKKYGEISKITFARITLTDIELNYIAEYNENNEPVIKSIEENTLINGEIKVAELNGTAISFNKLIDEISAGNLDGFMLIASDENHKTIINPNVEIDNNGEPDNPPESDEQENPDILDNIILFFDTAYVNITKAIKWAVTLMNKLFKLISKK